jgi:hypothetical protein
MPENTCYAWAGGAFFPVVLLCQFSVLEDTGLGVEKRGMLYRYKEIFFGAKILAMSRHIFSRVELTSTYRDQLLVSHRKETTLQHCTTFYNIFVSSRNKARKVDGSARCVFTTVNASSVWSFTVEENYWSKKGVTPICK